MRFSILTHIHSDKSSSSTPGSPLRPASYLCMASLSSFSWLGVGFILQCPWGQWPWWPPPHTGLTRWAFGACVCVEFSCKFCNHAFSEVDSTLSLCCKPPSCGSFSVSYSLLCFSYWLFIFFLKVPLIRYFDKFIYSVNMYWAPSLSQALQIQGWTRKIRDLTVWSLHSSGNLHA